MASFVVQKNLRTHLRAYNGTICSTCGSKNEVSLKLPIKPRRKMFGRRSKNKIEVKDVPRGFYTRESYDQTYEIVMKILSRITIQLTHKLTPFASHCWLAFFIFEHANISLALVSEVSAMIINLEGLLDIVRLMPCSGYTILCLIKSAKMVYERKRYVRLINELGDMWPQGRVTEEEHQLLDKSLKEIHFVTRGCDKVNLFFIFGFLWTAFFEYFKFRFGFGGKMMAHFVYWMPFDYMRDYYLEGMLAVQTWYTFIVIWINLCVDLLFCIFINHLTVQFHLLAIRIKKNCFVPADEQLVDSYPLGIHSKEFINNLENIEVVKDTEWKRQNDKRIVENFSFIFNRHRDLIRLSTETENLFGFILLVNFMNSSLLICLCGFCCVLVEKWNEAGYKIFLVTVMYQTYLLCWYGQKLIDASKEVSNSFYNCGWYVAPMKVKTSIIIMLQRCQKDVFVTTYGFSVVSLSSYTQIIKTAWSYFTLLLNTYNRADE